jgi:hypothetical protein
MGTNYKRRAIQWQYPDLVHGEEADFYICNEGEKSTIKDGKKVGSDEIFIWNTKLYPQPTDEEMIAWYNEKLYVEKRAIAYRAQNLSTHELIVALWEKVMEDRPEAANEIQKLREGIKLDNPK